VVEGEVGGRGIVDEGGVHVHVLVSKIALATASTILFADSRVELLININT
jgi:hypothetical protein